MKWSLILPDTCASTRCPLASSTLNMALGSGSLTSASTSMASFLAMTPRLLRQRQHFGATITDGDGVLEVGGEAAVYGADRPVVIVAPGAPVTHVHHGLQGQHHALHQDGPPVRRAVVRHLGILVHLTADAVAHVLSHHREAEGLRVLLDGAGDGPQRGSGPGGLEALPEGIVGHLDEFLGLPADPPHAHGEGRVGNKALVGSPQVYADDVPLLK